MALCVRKGSGFTGWIYQQSTSQMIPVILKIKKGHQMVTFIVPEYGYSDFNFSYDSFIFLNCAKHTRIVSHHPLIAVLANRIH
ncbi:hypothetical protein DF41_18000 [Raoultella planticola]|nr:hypothetical protein DF41_18000 [Raoultella planticola]